MRGDCSISIKVDFIHPALDLDCQTTINFLLNLGLLLSRLSEQLIEHTFICDSITKFDLEALVCLELPFKFLLLSLLCLDLSVDPCDRLSALPNLIILLARFDYLIDIKTDLKTLFFLL